MPRSWWRNCALNSDPEMLEIDGWEDRLGPLPPNISQVRALISTVELCHHKAERWVENIIHGIGSEATTKGLGARAPNQCHPAEQVWKAACAGLSAWCAGHPAESLRLSIGDVPAARLLASLGERSPLKEWQVQRVVDRVRGLIGWPPAANDPTAQYTWILLGAGEGESFYRRDCPEPYREHEEFWRRTVLTIIRDKACGRDATLSLGLAIDMLWPCHWNFVGNLRIVLDAIGGKLRADPPFAACGRNIELLPIRNRMETVAATLRGYCGRSEGAAMVDRDILKGLGEPADTKKWLAASLEKTIRLQLDPPEELRALAALSGPDWIRQ
jgi:hypothetical protein